jgi:hypothetical protein
MTDVCADDTLRAIKDYVPPLLQTPVKNGDKYIVGDNEYIIEYYRGDDIWYIGYSQVSYKSETITIEFVTMEEEKGKRKCSRIVAYLIKVCMMAASDRGDCPYVGRVHISSRDPCKAFLCYAHAFAMNGFEVDMDEVDRFLSLIQAYRKTSRIKNFQFLFKNFINKSQKSLQEICDIASNLQLKF